MDVADCEYTGGAEKIIRGKISKKIKRFLIKLIYLTILKLHSHIKMTYAKYMQTVNPQLPNMEIPQNLERSVGTTFFQQHLIASFDSQSRTLSESNFLKTEAPALTRTQTLDLLISLQRNEADYATFFDKLPNITLHNPDVIQPDIPLQPTDEKLTGIINMLAEPKGETSWIEICKKYSGSGRGIIQLADDLIKSNPNIGEAEFREILQLFHGDLRTEAYLEMARLDRISGQNPETWESFLGEVSRSQIKPQDSELKLLTIGNDEVLRANTVKFIEKQSQLLKHLKLRRSSEDPFLIIDKHGKKYDLQNRSEAKRLWEDYLVIRGGSGVTWVEKDLYKVLELPRTAIPDEIKRAFRNLAVKFHPDHNKQQGAEERFKEINEAYSILSNPEKRAKYDNLGNNAVESILKPDERLVNFYFDHLKGYTPPKDWHLDDSGWWTNRRTGEKIHPQTPQGAYRIIQEILRGLPDIWEDGKIGPFLNKYYKQPRAKKTPPQGNQNRSKSKYEPESVINPDSSVAGRTDVGQRENNEDNYFISPDGKYFGVFDGVGGASKGEVASKIAKETFANSYQRSLDFLMQEANTNIYRTGIERDLQMGTTGTVARIIGNKLEINHVGDSRAYLIRDKQIYQLTTDHVNPYKINQLTRVLGRDQEVNPDRLQYNLQEGDQILLCTDGLTRKEYGPSDAIRYGLTDAEILEAVAASATPKEKVRWLIYRANSKGGRDNITVIIKSFTLKK